VAHHPVHPSILSLITMRPCIPDHHSGHLRVVHQDFGTLILRPERPSIPRTATLAQMTVASMVELVQVRPYETYSLKIRIVLFQL